MRTFVYDRSFEGLLTAVFHAYARREFPDFLAVEGEPGPLFVEERFRVVTDEVLAARVYGQCGTSDEADGVQGGEGGAPAHAVRAFPEGGRWQLFCTRIAAV